MEMLTGNGQPPKHLKGQLGQHYKDLKTGDIYELVSANEFSTIHYAPVRGYIWKRVARGDHMEVCTGGAGGSGGAFDVVVSREETTVSEMNPDGYAYTADKTVTECIEAHKAGKIVRFYLDWYGGQYVYLNSVSEEEHWVSFNALWVGSSLTISTYSYGDAGDGNDMIYADAQKVAFET